jgi:hypothetical protein
MREYMDMVTASQMLSNRIEVILTEQTQLMLEAYKNPASDLNIEFKEVYLDPDQNHLYMTALVLDVTDQKPVVKVDYVLGSDQLVISNVISFRDHKMMHTSMGMQSGATDMGHAAVRWLLKELLKHARMRGFTHTQIASTTRYSGARAVNGTQTDASQEPINYSVNQKLAETRLWLGPWSCVE